MMDATGGRCARIQVDISTLVFSSACWRNIFGALLCCAESTKRTNYARRARAKSADSGRYSGPMSSWRRSEGDLGDDDQRVGKGGSAKVVVVEDIVNRPEKKGG